MLRVQLLPKAVKTRCWSRRNSGGGGRRKDDSSWWGWCSFIASLSSLGTSKGEKEGAPSTARPTSTGTPGMDEKEKGEDNHGEVPSEELESNMMSTSGTDIEKSLIVYSCC